MVARCLHRAKTSGRADDTEEVIEKRIKVFEDQSKAVVEMYKQFGKVREVSSAANVFEVWNNTRAAILPTVSFMIGPKNVDTYSQALAQRTNSKVINFAEFVREHGLRKADDDTKILSLIQGLADEVCPRVLLTGFPQTEYQARFFIKNSGEPRACYVLNCSKDFVQAEMMDVPQNSPGYVSSAQLTKQIGKYNNNMKELLPFLRKSCDGVFEIDIERPFHTVFKDICARQEPTIICVRSGGGKEANHIKNLTVSGL